MSGRESTTVFVYCLANCRSFAKRHSKHRKRDKSNHHHGHLTVHCRSLSLEISISLAPLFLYLVHNEVVATAPDKNFPQSSLSLRSVRACYFSIALSLDSFILDTFLSFGCCRCSSVFGLSSSSFLDVAFTTAFIVSNSGRERGHSP